MSEPRMPDDDAKNRLACEEPLRELDGLISALTFMAFGLDGGDRPADALHAIARGLRRNTAELRKALDLPG